MSMRGMALVLSDGVAGAMRWHILLQFGMAHVV